MNKFCFSKIVLFLDLIICVCWFIALDFSTSFKVLLWGFPLLRMWLAFLTYRKSKMAIYPIVMLTILNTAILLISGVSYCAFELYLEPVAKLINSAGHLIGWQVDEILVLIQEWMNGGTDTAIKVSFCGFWLMIFVPFVLYIYRYVKKQLFPSELGKIKSWGLCLYLSAFACFLEAFMPYEFCVSGSLVVIALAVMFVPFIFYRKNQYKGILSRLEVTILFALALLPWGYFCGLGIDWGSVFPVLLLPAAFYALVNWYYVRKMAYEEFVVIIMSSSCVWFSQYVTGSLRVFCLFLSLILVIWVLFLFVRDTKKWMAGVGMALVIGLFLPILCIGYNPYSCLQVIRLGACKDYKYSPNGLLYVKSEKGMGIRDRYEMILPAEFDRISILDAKKPYFKVRTKDKVWQIYDIERKQFVTDDPIYKISSHELEGVYRVETEYGEGCIVLPDYYKKDGDEPTPEKLLFLKFNRSLEFIKKIKRAYYHENLISNEYE